MKDKIRYKYYGWDSKISAFGDITRLCENADELKVKLDKIYSKVEDKINNPNMELKFKFAAGNIDFPKNKFEKLFNGWKRVVKNPDYIILPDIHFPRTKTVYFSEEENIYTDHPITQNLSFVQIILYPYEEERIKKICDLVDSNANFITLDTLEKYKNHKEGEILTNDKFILLNKLAHSNDFRDMKIVMSLIDNIKYEDYIDELSLIFDSTNIWKLESTIWGKLIAKKILINKSSYKWKERIYGKRADNS